MAASEETCAGNPNFAIICSFITNFGNDCGVTIPIPYLQEMLEDTKTVHQDLLEIILHLMRRGKKRVNKERWEKCLVKFCHEYSSVDAWEIERFGFLKSKLSVKLELLKRLLELQFDANAKFKAEVNKIDAGTLRLLPIGKDIDGQAYWFQLDKEYNMRLYRENMGEESSWQLLCSTTEDLKTLIASLEKTFSCPGSDSCDDKLNDPKSPSSDMPVPKKEQDGEEMTSCLSESKPCTIIIKTEKKEPSDTPVKSENCAIVTSTEPENFAPDNVTKGSVKLKLKLESSSNSKNELNSTVREYSIVTEKCAISAVDTEVTEMDIDKTTETTENILNSDIEMKNIETLSTTDTNSLKLSEEHSDQNIPNNSKTDVDTEKSDSVSHKSSKIKLYEKWSNEKRKLDTIDLSAKESSLSSKDVIESKEQQESLSVNKINEPAIPPKSIPEQPVKDQKSSLDDQNLNPDPDMAVDLSKSSRVNVIVQNTSSKPLCSTDTSVKSSAENSASHNDCSATNLKIMKNSELSIEKSSEKITDLKKRSLESESEKFYGRSRVLSGYYDVPAISDSKSTSVFSHLQALQNMCETNLMGGIPSVIQSTNRLKPESNKTVISENKSGSNAIVYEKMNKNYNFNDVHTSLKSNSSDLEASNILLKSNVQMKNDIDKQNDKFLDKNDVSNFKESVNNEANKSQEQPEDLSSQAISKSKGIELKTDFNCNLDECSSSATIEKHPDTLKTISEMDNENENSTNKKCTLPVEKDLDAPKLFPCYSDDCGSLEKNVSNSNSSKQKSSSPSSVKSKDPKPEETVRDPCNGENNKLCSKSAIESIEIDNSKFDVSDKLSESKNLQNNSDSSLEEKAILESKLPNELPKSVDSDEKLCSIIPAAQKSSDDSVTDLSLSIKNSHTESFESVLKDSERKFSVFSKPSSKVSDIESYESKAKTPCEIKIAEEFGSESKDSLSEPPDLKESCNSVISISEDYKPSSPSNESEISEPPPLLKEDLKTPVKNNSSLLPELKKDNVTKHPKNNIKDKSSTEKYSANVDEKQETVTNKSESTVSIDVDKNELTQYETNASQQSKKNDKNKNEIAREADIEKKTKNDKNENEIACEADIEKKTKNENEIACEADIEKKTKNGKNENEIACEADIEKKTKNDKNESEIACEGDIKKKTKKDNENEIVCEADIEKKTKNDENEIVCEADIEKKTKNDKNENKIASVADIKKKTKNDKNENEISIETDIEKKTKNDKNENEISIETDIEKKTKNDKNENEISSETDIEKKTKNDINENEIASEVDIEKKTKNDKNENEIASEVDIEKKTKNDKNENEIASEVDIEKETKNGKNENEIANEADIEKKTKNGKNENEKANEADIEKKMKNDKNESEIVTEADTTKTTTKSDDNEELETCKIKKITKSKKKKSKKKLNDKSAHSESDTCKIEAFQSENKISESNSVASSEEAKVFDKESSTVTDHDVKEEESKSCKGKKNSVQFAKKDENDSAKNDDDSDSSENKLPKIKKNCDNNVKCDNPDLKDSSKNTTAEKVAGKQSPEHSKKDDITLKDDKNSKSEKNKENETSFLEKDISDSEKNQTSLDEINSEISNQKLDKLSESKKPANAKPTPRRRGRARKIFGRRSTRRSKKTYEEIEVDSDVNRNSKEVNEKSKECPVNSVNIEDSSSDKERKTPIKESDFPKSAISSENTSEMLLKIYNLRHSTCLESKSKHPLCDKYVKSPVPVLCIDISNSDTKVSPTKVSPKGKKTKQPVTKKPQPAAKPATPAKKTPPVSSKKKPARNQKKNEVQKEDFAIPEGFLEILDKETSGKKRKGVELKLVIDSQNSSDNDSMPRKRSRRIQEQHQKKMTELAVEMEREQRILEQLAKRSNSSKKNNKSTPQKTPEKPNVKGPSAKNTPTKSANTPTKTASTPIKPVTTPAKAAKSPRTPKTPTIIAEEDTLMDSRRTTRKMNSRSKNLTRMTLLYEDESKDSNFSTSRETEKSKKKRRRKRHRKGTYKPWDLSSESSSSIEVFTEEEEEEQDEPLIFEVNEDEFACEEVDPNAEPVIIRRARTAKKTEIQDAEEECLNDDTPCQKCGKYDKPEWILLCDKCDKGYHTHCLMPPLMIVPDGDWFCQPCEHLALCQCLHEELNKLEVILKQREREALRKQRLAYVGISLDNVLKPEKKEKSDESAKEDKEEKEEEEEEKEEKVKEKENRKASRTRQTVEDDRDEKLYGKRSVRARRNVNYQFKEYDELIFSALQEDMIEVPEEFKEELGSEVGSDKPFAASLPRRKKRARRFADFGSSEEDSEDNYQGGSTDSEATAPPSSVSEQESGSGEEWRVTKSSGGKRKTSHRKPQSRRRRRRRGRGDSSEEDWDDEEVEQEPYRPTTRRAAQKAVSYRELSESEEDEWGASKREVSHKRRKASSSESEASFKKKVSKKKRIRKWGSSESSEESEEKSMSSSGETEEDEADNDDDDDDEDESDKELKDDKKEQSREKLSIKKKVLNSDEDEEEEPAKNELVPKKKTKKVVSEESDDEEEEEEEDDEEDEEEEDEEEEDDDEEDEEDEEESESEEESADDEKRVQKKSSVPEKKIPIIDNKMGDSENKQDAEKKNPPVKLSDALDPNVIPVDKKENVLSNEKNELTPKVLVKKELCSVDIPLELNKPTITITPVSEKTYPKTVRKEATKMVPCVIPYEKSPRGSQVFTPDDEADQISSKEGEILRPTLTNRPPIQIPKQGAVYAPPPSSRIQYSGALSRHSVLPISSPMRPSVPPSSLQPRMPVPTNLSIRPSPSSVVVQHSSPSSRMTLRPPLPVSKPTPSSSAAPPTPPSKQTVPSKPETKPYKSTIMEPFSNMDDENDSDDEVPLERIPTAVPAAPQNRPVSFEKDAEYRPAAKELSSYSYAPPEEKQYSGSYSSLSTLQDLSTRPSPLKPSLVETYPNNSSPSKLTPLDSYSRTNSPKGFISLDSYSENKKKKHFFGNSSQEGEPSNRPPQPPPSENYQGGEIRFPPEPYPCPQSPNSYSQRSPPPNQRDAGTPPRLYSQFPDAYAPPRSPEYYQNHQYYASEERIPRPSYQPNYVPPEPSFVSNPYVATPVPQPNGGFMIDTLLQARNPENEDELTGVTDIVSYITQE